MYDCCQENSDTLHSKIRAIYDTLIAKEPPNSYQESSNTCDSLFILYCISMLLSVHTQIFYIEVLFA